MRLKIITTAFVITGLVLMILWPKIVGPTPDIDVVGRKAVAEWGVRMLTYFGIVCLTWISAAACAIALAKRTQREFLEQERQNLQELVEGTLKDHGRE